MKVIKITKKKQCYIIEFEENHRCLVDPLYLQKKDIQPGDDIDFDAFLNDNEQYQYQTALDSAFFYLSYASRTEKQISDYLAKKHIEKSIIIKVLEKLKDYKYADDETYAANYVALGLDAQKGKQYLKRKMKQKGLSDKHIEKSLAVYDEETELENARNFIEKQNKLLIKNPPLIRKEKIYQKAVGQGFSFGVLTDLLNEIIVDEEEDNYEEYFIKKIDKKCCEYIKKGLEVRAIKSKLYAAFLPLGAKKAMIDERLQLQLNESISIYE